MSGSISIDVFPLLLLLLLVVCPVLRFAWLRNCSSNVSSFCRRLYARIKIVFRNRFTDDALMPPPMVR
jgi:hypothetical protein